MESILKSIKKLLGIDETETAFDMDILIHINSAFASLNQMGVGSSKTFTVYTDDDTWNEFTENDEDLNNVKTYVYLKVRLVFDPPTSSTVLASMENQIKELEWRLNVCASNKQ